MKHFTQNPSINLSFSIFSANSKFEGWFDHWIHNQLLKISSFFFSHLPLGRISLLNHKLKSNSWKISIWFSKELPFLLGPNFKNSLCKGRGTFLRFLLRLFLGFRPQSQASALRLALKPKKSLWERLWRTFCEALPQALPDTLLESLAPNLGFCL